VHFEQLVGMTKLVPLGRDLGNRRRRFLERNLRCSQELLKLRDTLALFLALRSRTGVVSRLHDALRSRRSTTSRVQCACAKS
jgi:hypothetical protein